MTTQTTTSSGSDTLPLEPDTLDFDVDPTVPPVLLLAGDREIIRRIREAAPRWWQEAPSQALVQAVTIQHDKDMGLRGTCGPERARRLRDLATNLDLVVDEGPAADVLDAPSDEAVEAAWEHLTDALDTKAAHASPESDSDQTGQAEAVDSPVDTGVVEADTARSTHPRRPWIVLLLTLPAFVAIWSGWVGMGRLTGFGPVNPLPGTPLADWTIDTAITLPIGMEAYAAYALSVCLGRWGSERTRRFAKWSAGGALALGMAGQVAYHLMTAAGITSAPWWITTAVACLPVAVLGAGAGLAHMVRSDQTAQ